MANGGFRERSLGEILTDAFGGVQKARGKAAKQLGELTLAPGRAIVDLLQTKPFSQTESGQATTREQLGQAGGRFVDPFVAQPEQATPTRLGMPLTSEERQAVLSGRRDAFKQFGKESALAGISQNQVAQRTASLSGALAGAPAPTTEPAPIPSPTTTTEPVQTLEETPQTEKRGLSGLDRFLVAIGAGLTQAGGKDPSSILNLAQQRLKDQQDAELEKVKQAGKIDIEAFKQNRLDQREILKAKLDNEGADDTQATFALLGQDLTDLIDAREQISLRGPVAGRFGALTLQQRGERAAFDSIAETTVFSIGQALLNQTGRGFTEGEQKNAREKILGASIAKTDDEFKSKINSVIRLANNRIVADAKRKGETPNLIPQFDDLVQGIRSRQQGAVESAPDVTDLGGGVTLRRKS